MKQRFIGIILMIAAAVEFAQTEECCFSYPSLMGQTTNAACGCFATNMNCIDFEHDPRGGCYDFADCMNDALPAKDCCVDDYEKAVCEFCPICQEPNQWKKCCTCIANPKTPGMPAANSKYVACAQSGALENICENTACPIKSSVPC